MKLENAIRILAGPMLLTSLGLAHWVSQWWLLLPVFVGVNLVESALTGFCPAEIILRKLGAGTDWLGGTNIKLRGSESPQITT